MFMKTESSLIFFSKPRLLTHIDASAIEALANFYSQNLDDDTVVVDLCSSWIPHLPPTKKFKKVVGIGRYYSRYFMFS